MTRREVPGKRKGGPGWKRWAVLVFLLALAAPPLIIAFVLEVTEPRRYADPAHVPAAPVAIVFGAGITRQNTPTPMLADRVAYAARLYQLGRVTRLLMTGDGSRGSHDEVNVMRQYAQARGVPASSIMLDAAGFSTYDSCYRAVSVFGVTRAVVVTQNFHLPRALYTCRELGIDAVGLGTPDWGVYSDGLMTAYTAREVLAIFKAVWEVNVALPLPSVRGVFQREISAPGVGTGG
ncbi:MAG: vancomycin high temperature exclusion protein [Rudaea sp.]